MLVAMRLLAMRLLAAALLPRHSVHRGTRRLWRDGSAADPPESVTDAGRDAAARDAAARSSAPPAAQRPPRHETPLARRQRQTSYRSGKFFYGALPCRRQASAAAPACPTNEEPPRPGDTGAQRQLGGLTRRAEVTSKGAVRMYHATTAQPNTARKRARQPLAGPAPRYCRAGATSSPASVAPPRPRQACQVKSVNLAPRPSAGATSAQHCNTPVPQGGLVSPPDVP
jgi:hypothetical protein